TFRTALSENSNKFFWWNNTSPSPISPEVPRSSCIIERDVTLFPQPDSPTIPTISPLFTPKLTPRTTWVVTSSDVKAVFRFLTSNKYDIIRRSFNPLFLDPTHLLIHHQTSLMSQLLNTQRKSVI